MKKGIIIIVALLTLALGGSLIQKNNRQMLLAEEETNYLFEEDFSSPKPEYSDVFTIEEGLAYPIADSSRQKAWTKNFLPEEKVSSNNYSVSFDMKLLTTETNSSFFFHFLDATNPGDNGASIYYSLEQKGQWVCCCSVNEGYASTGTGAPTNHKDGSIRQQSVDLTADFVRIEIIYYETIMELYVDGHRYISQALCNLGNNKWSTRYSYSEGNISGFIFHWLELCPDKPTYVIDNIKMKEYLPSDNPQYSETVDVSSSTSKIFADEIAGNKLGYSSYSVEATFTPKKTIVGNHYIKVEMCGLNGLCGAEKNGDNYSIDFCLKISATAYTPYIAWCDNGVKQKEGDPINGKPSSYKIKVVVKGANVQFYVNDTRVMDISFVEDLYVYKGVFQCLSLVNSSSIVWTSMKYQKEVDAIEAVSVTSNKSIAYVGDEVSFTASYEPTSATYNTIKWMVNGSEAECNSLTYNITAENVGLLKVNCIIDGVTSPFAYVNVKAREVSSSEPQQSSDTSHPTSEKEGKGSGCSGSVTTMASITSLGAILGIYFLLFKKKEEK